MKTPDTQLLRIAHFSHLTKWSAYDAETENVKFRFPLVPLAKLLKRIKEPTTIQDNTRYKRITVRLYGQGVLQRDELLGKEIGTKRQFVVHAGQLIISRIDARNGAFGIVPDDLEGAIVTNDFWLFEVQNALPQYLILVLSSDSFRNYWQSKSSGTTNRQRVSENDLLSSKIALPPLQQQQSYINQYNTYLSQAELNEQEVKNEQERVNVWFLNKLGIIHRTSWEPTNLINICHLKDLNRWDIWTNRDEYYSEKYITVPFSRLVLGNPMYGANEKAIKKVSDVRYIRITDIREDGSLGDDFVSVDKVNPKYLLSENDFLIARSGNTVGKTFLYTSKIGKAIFAGYLVKYIIDTKKLLPKYLFYYSKSIMFKQWVKANQRIFGQPNINGKEYLTAPIILPPLELQTKIVRYIEIAYKKIKVLQEKSLFLRKQAKDKFELSAFESNIKGEPYYG